MAKHVMIVIGLMKVRIGDALDAHGQLADLAAKFIASENAMVVQQISCTT
ncbi:MAG: hypothetical protein Q9P14_16615 [candidate division KSB1 bacterium]|nr:hypothetical protein [candidate division KSB1 bacterium]MDQ7064943.1 hypothetical protein [candidate division KSB1 bacterium]